MSQTTEHPQRPRLTVRVGVTGHRKQDLEEADETKLRQSIHDSLKKIQDVAASLQASQTGKLYQTGPPVLRLLSSLAEGADQMVAEVALEMGFELHCPLPFAADDYTREFDDESKKGFERSFPKATAVLQLDGSSTSEQDRSAAYLAAGRVILRQCDVLLAVWNGLPPKGIGGTGQIVEEAAALEIPTIWIGSKPPHLAGLRAPRTSLQESHTDLGAQGLEEGLSRLEERLQGSLLPSNEFLPGHDSWHFKLRTWILSWFGKSLPRSECERAVAFFEEKKPHQWPGQVFRLYRFVWAGQKKPFQEPQDQWKKFETRWPHLGERIESCYGKPFGWADRLANACVGLYRDSFVSSYMLGAIAVLFALSGLHAAYNALPGERHEAGIPWFAAELALILTILVITNLGWFLRWHERWMDYRPLAEALRQMKFLDLLARIPSSFKVPAHLGAGDPRRSWFNWYFRALVREAGLISGPPVPESNDSPAGGARATPLVLDQAYLRGFKDVLAEAIEGQVMYHEDNHKIFHRLHHNSHIASQCAFGLAALGCFLHLFHQREPVEVTLSFFAIIAPGFGAALSAILFLGEFERIALRSQTIKAHLEQLKERLRGTELSSQALGQIAGEFSELMMAELVDWRFVFLGKVPALPA